MKRPAVSIVQIACIAIMVALTCFQMYMAYKWWELGRRFEKLAPLPVQRRATKPRSQP